MSWDQLQERFSGRTRENFVDQSPFAMGVEEEAALLWEDDFSSPSRDVYQQALQQLGEHQHIDLKYDGGSPWTDVPVKALVKDEFFDEELNSIAEFFPDEAEEEGYEDVVAEISFDLSNEFEIATGVNCSLVSAHNERELVNDLQVGSLPDGTAMYRIGHVPGFMLDHAPESFFNRRRWNQDDAFPTKADAHQFMTQKRRYTDHLKSHGLNVMTVGGTDSTQLTMRPAVPPLDDADPEAIDGTYGDGYTAEQLAVDDMFRAFYGGGEHTSISALAPILYAPFMSSPVFEEYDEDSMIESDDGLVSHMGREWAYERGFKDSEYVDMDGTRKFGYIPEMAFAAGTEDILDVFADKYFQFSAEVAADSEFLTVKGADRTLYDMYHDDHPHLEEDTGINIRVGHDDYGPINFKQFAEDRRFEGIVSLPNPDAEAEEEEVVVEVDYSELPDEVDDEDEDDFYDKAWGHFLAHASTVWPNFRPRFDAGAVESRDFGNSPRIKEAIDTQAAIFRKWDEIQEWADEELDMWEGYADIVRDGVAEEGLGFVLPSGDTVRTAWLGSGRDRGLLDILQDGVREASYGCDDVPDEARNRYARDYFFTMRSNLIDGTYADEMNRGYRNISLDHMMRKTQVKRSGDRADEDVVSERLQQVARTGQDADRWTPVVGMGQGGRSPVDQVKLDTTNLNKHYDSSWVQRFWYAADDVDAELQLEFWFDRARRDPEPPGYINGELTINTAVPAELEGYVADAVYLDTVDFDAETARIELSVPKGYAETEIASALDEAYTAAHTYANRIEEDS